MAVAQRHRLQVGPTTMYAQLASILRGKILSGMWPDGYEIPTLIELCDQYDVARVTARQAVQTLVAEGLLSSRRGRRTFVCGPPTGGAAPIFVSAGVLSEPPSYSIEIVSKTVVDTLPKPPFVGEPEGRYVRISKIDSESRVPYAYSVNYVAEEVATHFTRPALRKTKLARLILDAAPDLALARDRIFVGVADFEEARLLDCLMSSAVARVERVFCDAGGRVVYFGAFTYRGDRFASEHDILPMLKDGG